MAEKIETDFQSSYIPVEINSLLREYAEGEQIGEASRVAELDDIFKWMRGTINAWYGWANDGKGTFFDFMAVMKSKIDDWKWCIMKQEDMSSTRYKDEPTRITANRIHKSLVWTMTGKTPYKHYSEKHNTPFIDKKEYIEALKWVDKHFLVIYPKDRRFASVMKEFAFMHEKFGVDGFLIDPFKSLKLGGEGTKEARTDWMMDDLFIETKEFALRTNTTFNFIAHPKSMTDTKDKDGRFKVVNQFMIAGGAAWDNNMDSQYSIFRPERHLNPADPKVHFHNLKQRNSEEVLARRGVYEDIKFDPKTKRYYFNGICPLDGTAPPVKPGPAAPPIDFSAPNNLGPDDVPF